jgi:hypothetical protein
VKDSGSAVESIIWMTRAETRAARFSLTPITLLQLLGVPHCSQRRSSSALRTARVARSGTQRLIVCEGCARRAGGAGDATAVRVQDAVRLVRLRRRAGACGAPLSPSLRAGRVGLSGHRAGAHASAWVSRPFLSHLSQAVRTERDSIGGRAQACLRSLFHARRKLCSRFAGRSLVSLAISFLPSPLSTGPAPVHSWACSRRHCGSRPLH